VFESLLDEILTVYIEYRMKEKKARSYEDFFVWYEEVGIACKNFKLAFDFVFGLLHPLFLFRAAIRQCNDKVWK
jgi:hypothetical protein